MTKNPITFELETPVTEARYIMQREKIHRLPVLDKKGGDIISFGTFLGDDQSNALCTIKVQHLSKNDLLACLEPFVEEVRDLREV